MIAAFKTLLARADQLTLRERLILGLLLIAALWAAADLLLFAPLQAARAAQTERIQAAQARMATLDAELARQQGQIAPAAAAQQRLAASQAAFEAGLGAAGPLRQRLVAPGEMTRLLRDLTRDQPGLRLVRLHALPPQAIGAPPAPAGGEPGGIYRQGVSLTVAGPYAALVAYMEALERLPVFWGRAELDAEAHPQLELTLTLYTLSLERTWLRF